MDDALRARYLELDIEVSKALGVTHSSVEDISLSEIAGSLIAFRLVHAGEKLGLSALPEGRDVTRLAGLTACAIYAAYSAKSAMEQTVSTQPLDLDGLREGALSPVAARVVVLGGEWRSDISRLISLASKQLFTNDASQSGNAEKFKNAVSSLGILEIRAFERGSEDDMRQDQLAAAISKMLFSMIE
ncbi:MAG: hypothetical protein KDJ63_11210 [Nitratireductor sp.]|nr:hypothetical protein [Nitratireductor sp.]